MDIINTFQSVTQPFFLLVSCTELHSNQLSELPQCVENLERLTNCHLSFNTAKLILPRKSVILAIEPDKRDVAA